MAMGSMTHIKGPTPEFWFLPGKWQEKIMSRVDEQVIFRRYRKVGDRVLDAHKYGLKAWPIRIRRKPKKKQ